MIAELAAFNAAFGVVKAALANGRDIADCASHIGKMISAEETLKARGERKKKSVWYALAGKDTNDFEEFMALEKVRTQRAELLQAMQLYGRAGLKDDYIRFEIEARKKRREQEQELKKARQERVEVLIIFGGVLLGAVVVLGVLWLIGVSQGRW